MDAIGAKREAPSPAHVVAATRRRRIESPDYSHLTLEEIWDEACAIPPDLLERRVKELEETLKFAALERSCEKGSEN